MHREGDPVENLHVKLDQPVPRGGAANDVVVLVQDKQRPVGALTPLRVVHVGEGGAPPALEVWLVIGGCRWFDFIHDLKAASNARE